MSGFKGDLIHSFNKNENAVHNSAYFSNIAIRKNCILLGDSLGDLGMVNRAHSKNILKIGFLNEKVGAKKKYTTHSLYLFLFHLLALVFIQFDR